MLIKHSRKTHTSNSFEKTLNANKKTKEMRIGWFYMHLKYTTALSLFWDIQVPFSPESLSSCWIVSMGCAEIGILRTVISNPNDYWNQVEDTSPQGIGEIQMHVCVLCKGSMEKTKTQAWRGTPLWLVIATLKLAYNFPRPSDFPNKPRKERRCSST